MNPFVCGASRSQAFGVWVCVLNVFFTIWIYSSSLYGNVCQLDEADPQNTTAPLSQNTLTPPFPQKECEKHLSNKPVTRITVVLPNYKNLDLCEKALRITKQRASNDPSIQIEYFVLNQEEDNVSSLRVHTVLDAKATVVDYPQPGVKGGIALHMIFKAAMMLSGDTDITITVDTDTFILANNWDQRVVQIFSDPDVVVAGINPRRVMNQFAGVVEWNWMAFRTSFYRIPITSWRIETSLSATGLYDWGHWFTLQANLAGKKQHRWDNVTIPIKDKSPKIVGDSVHSLWAMHFFYASRVNTENLSAKTNFVVTKEQSEALLAWVESSEVSLSTLKQLLPKEVTVKKTRSVS